MGDVVNLKPPEAEYCFVCGCGSQDFILMYGGTIECGYCRHTILQAAWIHIPPEIARKADG